MIPAFARRGLRCQQADVVAGLDSDAAARRHRHESCVSKRQSGRLVGVAREFRDRPERSQAPIGFMIGKLAGEKFEVARGGAHLMSLSGFAGTVAEKVGRACRHRESWIIASPCACRRTGDLGGFDGER
jgi:hypothetical protein